MQYSIEINYITYTFNELRIDVIVNLHLHCNNMKYRVVLTCEAIIA
jgi:hypothetical protein